jgi:hypothetical protein
MVGARWRPLVRGKSEASHVAGSGLAREATAGGGAPKGGPRRLRVFRRGSAMAYLGALWPPRSRGPTTARALASLRRSDDRPSPGSRTLFPEIEKLLARPAGH